MLILALQIRVADATVVILYLAIIVAIGTRYSFKKNRTSESYFVGKRDFPGWVVGLSMLGAIISSTTFLALPGAAYVLDWRQLDVNLVMPVIAVVAMVVFIPFFRRAGLTSAFEYLGDRFGLGARIYGTLSFVFLQLARLAIILALVALPIQFLTGVPIEWVIVGGALFVALFSVAAGIESVVWADAAQTVIMIGGGLLCLACLLAGIPGGFGQVVAVGRSAHKFALGGFAWDIQERTFWTVAILGVVNWITVFGGEQTMVQRYVSARSTREARKATALFAFLALPIWTTFFFIGTALFVYYRARPDPQVALLQPDQVLAYFVLTKIPAGCAGLVIAAILSAAMGSLSAGVNSIASVLVVDIIKPHLLPARPDGFYLGAARVTAIVALAAAALGALTLVGMRKESMNDVSLVVASVFGGCLMGLFMLGFFTRRVDGRAVVVALVIATLLDLYLVLGALAVLPAGFRPGLQSYLIGPIVNAMFIVVAYGLSVLRRVPPAALPGLTIWSLPSAGVPAADAPEISGRHPGISPRSVGNRKNSQ